MKNKKRHDARSRFRRRVFFDIVASAAITCIAEIFLVLNLNMVTGFLRQNGYQLHMFDMQGEGMLPWIFFYVIIPDA